MYQSETLLFFILLQLIVMILAARLMHTLFRRLGQPGVIGEVIAGLMLGPSCAGYFFPHPFHALFGEQAVVPVTIISQIGLIFLMFQIGLEFDAEHLRPARNRRGVFAVAFASIAVPLALGFGLGQWSAPTLLKSGDPLAYSLFCGVGLAITAMPVLGRILHQYGLSRTETGVVAISAAAINDVVGWLLLAGVSAYATAKLSGAHLLIQVGGFILFLVALRYLLSPLVDRLLARQRGEMSSNLMACVICLMLALGVCTYELGIFAIFGGFAAGLLFHRHRKFVAAWQERVGQFVLVFFLPVFFTFTGLRTDLLGLGGATDALWLCIMVGAGIAGKMIPVYLAGRFAGYDSVRSWTLGALMNTRGLMELIVLNIGYELKVIPQDVFSMLVVMAVVTSAMTGPLLQLLLPRMGHKVAMQAEA